MKTEITSLLLFLTFFSTSAQDLDFVHSYGPTEDGDSNDKVYSAKFDENFGRVVVAGQYTNEINLQIGSSTVNLTSDLAEDELQGFVAIYSEDFELLNEFNIGSLATGVSLLTDSTFLVVGRYGGLIDFDPRPGETFYKEGVLIGEGFANCYKLDGTPVWMSFYESNSGVWMSDLALANESVFVSGYSGGSDLQSIYNNDTLELMNEDGTNSFLMNYNFDGTLNFYKIFDMEEESCTVQAVNSTNDHLAVTLRVNAGELNLSLTSNEETISFNEDLNSAIPTYSLTDNSMDFYTVMDVVEEDNIGWPQHSAIHELFGGVTAFKCRGNNLSFSTSMEVSEIEINEEGDLDYLYISSVDETGQIKWQETFPFSTINLQTKDIITDAFGYSYYVGHYQGILYYEDENILEENSSSLNNGFIMKLDPIGNLVWAHNIPAQQGELEVNSISVNQEQDILISGYYTGNHDFDFSENTELVGNFEEENGFLARYTQEPNEAQVFLNVPILHTGIEEAGANSLVYVSINREISEDVVVEATPDDQIDLGNGAGQPVELTFTPDGEKIMSLDVMAFDDLDVEGDHTGTITFSSSGETNFASLDAQTVTFDIIDNDPDAVVEQNVESEISIYPNPATNEITIEYPQKLAGKTIDLIRIIDMNGRSVLEIKDHPKDQKVAVEDLRRSSYLLKVSTDKNEFTTKLLLL